VALDNQPKGQSDPITQIIQAATGVKSRNALLTVAIGIGGYVAKFVQQTAEDIRQIRYELVSFNESLKQVKENQRDHESRLRFLEIEGIKKRRK